MSRSRSFSILILLSLGALWWSVVKASPPAVGMISTSRTCLSCHANTGPWEDGSRLVVDLLDKGTMASLRQPDGSFQITCKRGETASVITVLGYRPEENQTAPHRNGWIFVDTTLIGTPSVSKFAAGWEADVIYGCKIVGDQSAAYADAAVTVAPLTVRATESAKNTDLMLQFMLTSGEAVKNKAKEGLLGNYFTRTIRLRVTE